MIGLAVPGRPIRSLVAEDWSAIGSLDRTGLTDAEWKRVGSGATTGHGWGPQRTTTVTHGLLSKQVSNVTEPPTQATRRPNSLLHGRGHRYAVRLSSASLQAGRDQPSSEERKMKCRSGTRYPVMRAYAYYPAIQRHLLG